MHRLTLARHAKSSWDHAGLADFDRPLNERGERDAPRMARRMSRMSRLPDRIISSPAARAIETARHYGRALGMADTDITQERRIYDASTQTLAWLLRELPAEARHVLLVGHNPGFSELANWLADCPFDDMPTCAFVVIELHVENWSEVGPGCGQACDYLFPKDGRD